MNFKMGLSTTEHYLSDFKKWGQLSFTLCVRTQALLIHLPLSSICNHPQSSSFLHYLFAHLSLLSTTILSPANFYFMCPHISPAYQHTSLFYLQPSSFQLIFTQLVCTLTLLICTLLSSICNHPQSSSF